MHDSAPTEIMSKIEFLFINTVDLRCQVPSATLERTIATAFVAYDENKDGLISQSEWSEIMTRLEIADALVLSSPITLS